LDFERQEVFMAFFEDETLPFIGICMKTWRPSFVLRGGERFLPMDNIYVYPAEDHCTSAQNCLDAFCPLNHTVKNHLEGVLYLAEQEWFRKNWLDIVDQCKVAYAKDPTKHYTTLNLKPKQEPVGQK
jgi:hypothetical protein